MLKSMHVNVIVIPSEATESALRTEILRFTEFHLKSDASPPILMPYISLNL